MEFTKDSGEATYRIQAYDKDYVLISGKKYQCNLLIMPEQFIAPWGPKTYQELTDKDLNTLIEYDPQLILIGIGENTDFSSEKLWAPLKAQGIGVEIMSFASACRTYTLLQAEGRNVLALLFFH